ncbi:Uncharacterized protein QTN25_004714 [Entamoeba marina]
MILFVLFAVSFASDFSGCVCCEVEPNGCDLFSTEFSTLYNCMARVPSTQIPTDYDWWEIGTRDGYDYDTCSTPVGDGENSDYPVDDPCECMESFSDRVTTQYNCSTTVLQAFDEVCNKLGCKYCDFITPKCGDIQLKRCDLTYQQEIAQNANPTTADVCRALTAKTDCYNENNCDYSSITAMQQTVKQCRNSSCADCYQICETINSAMNTFILLSMLLVVFFF